VFCPGHKVVLGLHDARVHGGPGVVANQQLFVELLAGAQAGDDDLYVAGQGLRACCDNCFFDAFFSRMSDSPYETPQADDEISLLDLLNTITENLRLLIVGPLLAGIAALGVGYTLTPTFESRAVLRFESDKDKATGISNEVAVVIAHSEEVLLALLPSAPWLEKTHSRTATLANMRELIQPSHNKKDGTFVLTVKAPSGAQAQALNQAVIAQLREKSQPKGKLLSELQAREQAATVTLAELSKILPELTQRFLARGPESETAARTYNLLSQQRESAQREFDNVKARLQPFGAEATVQAPSLPDKPVQPKKALIAVVAALATGFALLLFVFVRQALRNAAKNPEDAGRLAAIRSNLARSLGLSRQ
jgi:capsular polysaccharide biosynthesis protein